jgi:DNA-binding FrmR family transcriptional regulator
MTKQCIHEIHAQIIKRLAEGYLCRVIEMVDDGPSCLELAQQFHAVEKVITEPKRRLIHRHVDSCFDVAANSGSSKLTKTKDVLVEFKAIARYL